MGKLLSTRNNRRRFVVCAVVVIAVVVNTYAYIIYVQHPGLSDVESGGITSQGVALTIFTIDSLVAIVGVGMLALWIIARPIVWTIDWIDRGR